mmetsp:Transcript_300/g.531  ORF Transcript_300/g.531 Transcript_300/m.531 type:complete len:160 (+) Transcript_300:103-582(+)
MTQEKHEIHDSSENKAKMNEMMSNESNNDGAVTAIVQYQGRATEEVQKIMKCVVAAKSEEKYLNENIMFLLWLYDGNFRKEVLRDTFIDALNLAAIQDEGTKRRPKMRKVCRDALNKMQQGADNCPIMLQKLTFNISRIISLREKIEKANFYHKLPIVA